MGIFANTLKTSTKTSLYIHIAVLLWGVTAILGKLIQLREFILVWYRMLLVSLLLLLVPRLYKELKLLSSRDFIAIGLIGILVALHWVLFYGAIKFSNASIALCGLSVTSLFTSFLEPMVNKTKFSFSDFLLGIMVVPGILLINQSIPSGYFLGWVFALSASFFAALFTSLNKKYTQNTPEIATIWVQLTFGLLFLSLILPIYIQYFPESFYLPSGSDIYYLLFLVVICTIIPYFLYLAALKNSTAFSTNLINNLEPIYGIILAAIIFKENKELTLSFYIGSFIIFLAVFLHPILKKIRTKKGV